LAQLVLNDLLGAELAEGLEDSSSSTLLSLLDSEDVELKESLLLLMHSLSLTVDGRSYLLTVPDLLNRLIKLLPGASTAAISNDDDGDGDDKEDAKQYDNLANNQVAQQALGVLQKLSGRRSVQQQLVVDYDMIEFIFNALRTDDHDVLDNDELMEYLTSTVMNLVVLAAGKRKCAEQAERYAPVLISLMEHPNPQVCLE
jgi:hypothetical protein